MDVCLQLAGSEPLTLEEYTGINEREVEEEASWPHSASLKGLPVLGLDCSYLLRCFAQFHPSFSFLALES